MVNRWLSKVTIAAVLSLPLLALTAPSVFAERNKISVLNNSGKTMTVLQSGSSEDDWGENLLDGPLPDRQWGHLARFLPKYPYGEEKYKRLSSSCHCC